MAEAPSTVRPAPFAAAAFAAPLATVMLISSTSSVVEFTVVVVPLIVKSPVTTKSLLTVTVPPSPSPRLIFVVEPAALPVPMLIVLVLPEPTAPVEILVVEDAVLP